MLNAGSMKFAAKRTAFGDVSNTLNVLRPSRDDSAIGGKGELKILEKGIPTQQDKKALSFLRPAQRPLSTSLSKTTSNIHASSVQPLTKKPSLEIQQPSDIVANTRKVVTKKSTAIFKDVAALPLDQSVPDTRQPLTNVFPIAPVHRELLPIKQSKSIEEHQDAGTKLTRHQSKNLEDTIAQEKVFVPQPLQQSTEELPVLRSDGIYIDEQGQVQVYDYVDPVELPEVVPIEKEGVLNEINTKQNSRITVDSVLDAPPGKVHPARKSTLTTVSEPEEYWDDEGEENYDEEGYVTARSFKSRGENTTGGATTILFPKANLKTKKEIAAAKELIERSKTAEELADEAWDTTMVAEYGEEIFQYMKDLEVMTLPALKNPLAKPYIQIKMLPNAHYMDNQAEIQWSMRAVLMDWIVQVHHRFNLLPETLFLCVNYIDRFLSCKVVSLGKLQLVGATAIFIAAKYEEIDCPSIQEIVYMVDSGYTIDEILKAERFMLSMLQFELGWPGPMSFLRRISKADDYDLETRTLAKYFLEVTIMDERFIGSPPSYVAAGAHCLARMMLKKGAWVRMVLFKF